MPPRSLDRSIVRAKQGVHRVWAGLSGSNLLRIREQLISDWPEGLTIQYCGGNDRSRAGTWQGNPTEDSKGVAGGKFHKACRERRTAVQVSPALINNSRLAAERYPKSEHHDGISTFRVGGFKVTGVWRAWDGDFFRTGIGENKLD